METPFQLEVFPRRLPSYCQVVEDSESSVSAVVDCCRDALLPPENRAVLLKAVARQAGAVCLDTLESVFVPLIEALRLDPEEEIRMSVAGILEPIGEAIHQQQSREASPAIGMIVGCGLNMVVDTSIDVREYALEASTGLAGLLNPERQEQLFGPAVQSCLYSTEASDRVSGVKLLGRLCKKGVYLGSSGQVVKWLVDISQDSSIDVRQEVGCALPAILWSLDSQPNFDVTLSRFLSLCNDSVWSVRDSCARSLPHLTNVMTQLGCSIQSHERIHHMHAKLCKDKSAWVRMSALISLGPVLVTTDAEPLNEELLEQFGKISSLRLGAAEINVILSCACHLPGVVLRTGKAKWDILRKMYLKFLDYPDEKVRYTLGCSAHEIAAILPTEITARDLVPGIKKLMGDPSPSVRLGMAKYLTRLLKSLPSDYHSEFLEQLPDLLFPSQTHLSDSSDGDERKSFSSEDCPPGRHNTRHWRVREMLCKGLGELARVVTPDSILKFVLPCAFALCHDNVALVRKLVADQLAEILEVCREEIDVGSVAANRNSGWDLVYRTILDKMINLGQAENFLDRCLCARTCSAAIDRGINVLNEPKLEDVVLGFQRDKVPDVRIAWGSIKHPLGLMS